MDGVVIPQYNSVCKFTMSGSAAATFNEATQQVKISQTGFASSPTNLKVSGVTGCFGQVTNGQNADFTGTFTLTSQDGRILIG